MKLLKLLKEIQSSALNKKIVGGDKETITTPPITKPEVRPVRRPLGNPEVRPKPKAENYGWDKSKGLTQNPKPEIKGTNKPKQKVTKESIIDKISQRFSNLKK